MKGDNKHLVSMLPLQLLHYIDLILKLPIAWDTPLYVYTMLYPSRSTTHRNYNSCGYTQCTCGPKLYMCRLRRALISAKWSIIHITYNDYIHRPNNSHWIRSHGNHTEEEVWSELLMVEIVDANCKYILPTLFLLHLLQDSLYVQVSNAMCTYRQRTWQGAAAIHTMMMIMICQMSSIQCVTYNSCIPL